MTKEQWMERLWIIQQWVDGETAQLLCSDGNYSNISSFNGIIFPIMIDYSSIIRIKPKAREWWAVMSQDSERLVIVDDELQGTRMLGLSIYKNWVLVKVRKVES